MAKIGRDDIVGRAISLMLIGGCAGRWMRRLRCCHHVPGQSGA